MDQWGFFFLCIENMACLALQTQSLKWNFFVENHFKDISQTV